MRPQTLPLDPDSPAGRAAAEELTTVLASIKVSIAKRRRQAAVATTQKAA
jgi:hypothetical protein